MENFSGPASNLDKLSPKTATNRFEHETRFTPPMAPYVLLAPIGTHLWILLEDPLILYNI